MDWRAGLQVLELYLGVLTGAAVSMLYIVLGEDIIIDSRDLGSVCIEFGGLDWVLSES